MRSCVCASVYACVCVCVCVRERARSRACVCFGDKTYIGSFNNANIYSKKENIILGSNKL